MSDWGHRTIEDLPNHRFQVLKIVCIIEERRRVHQLLETPTSVHLNKSRLIPRRGIPSLLPNISCGPFIHRDPGSDHHLTQDRKDRTPKTRVIAGMLQQLEQARNDHAGLREDTFTGDGEHLPQTMDGGELGLQFRLALSGIQRPQQLRNRFKQYPAIAFAEYGSEASTEIVADNARDRGRREGQDLEQLLLEELLLRRDLGPVQGGDVLDQFRCERQQVEVLLFRGERMELGDIQLRTGRRIVGGRSRCSLVGRRHWMRGFRLGVTHTVPQEKD